MTNTNDREAKARELVAKAVAFREGVGASEIDPGSIIGIWMATAAALESTLTRQPKPHTVETVAELTPPFEDGLVPFAARDREGVLWLVWETEDGDAIAQSYPVEGEEDSGSPIVVKPPMPGFRALGPQFPLTVLTPATLPTTSEIAKQAAELLATISAIGLSRIDVTAMEALIEFMRGSVASDPTDAQVEAGVTAAFEVAGDGSRLQSESHWHEIVRAAISAAAKVGGE
ncbi:hypothetical protein [Demequina globuliformis]|uniref:hypothetical protein n=1 Tax=Demequina globuliformis TaxID=676202 RepID=UPI000785067B|nr:hypothetical protein [Demequina globuliformis]